MTEKLTLEWCFKYPKARFKYRQNEHHYVEYPSLINLILSNPNYELQNVIIDSVIILRPLSSLTDEEKRRCKQLRAEYGILNSKGIINEADYLRSINIHVGDLPEGVYIYE